MGFHWIQQPFIQLAKVVKWCFKHSTTDYCPGWNRYFRVIYRPVGWLPLAGLMTIALALFITPSLWSIAGGIFGLWLIGLMWPKLSTWGVSADWCGGEPVVVEGEPIQLAVRIRNAWPTPLFGLAIVEEEQLPSKDGLEAEEEPRPPLALSKVNGLTRSTYELTWHLPRIGRIPQAQPLLECSFPFDVYRRRKAITVLDTTLVVPWSMDFNLTDRAAFRGTVLAFGEAGSQPGRDGDMTGLRPWYEGDSLRMVHWSQSARQGKLIVKQGGMPTQPRLRIVLSSADQKRGNLQAGHQRLLRRWLSTVGRTLLSQGNRLELYIENQWYPIAPGPSSLNRLLELMAECDLHEMICSRTEVASQRDLWDEGVWEFILGEDHTAAAMPTHSDWMAFHLPKLWTHGELPDFEDFESELEWCEKEFRLYWQACFSREDTHRVIA